MRYLISTEQKKSMYKERYLKSCSARVSSPALQSFAETNPHKGVIFKTSFLICMVIIIELTCVTTAPLPLDLVYKGLWCNCSMPFHSLYF